MNYTTIKKYNRKASLLDRAVASSFQTEYALYVGCALVLLLSFLYVAETNAVMLLERIVPQKESAMLDTEQTVTKLEIAAAQMQSGQQVKEVAQARNMVFSGTVTYVSVNDSSVALVR